VDEIIPIETHSSHALRLLLVFLGALLGLLVLSFVFGSSSARADDGGDSPDSLGSAVGGVVADVTQPVQATITAVSHTVPAVAPVAQAVHTITQAGPAATITTPIAGVADATVTKILGEGAVGTTPVGTLLDPVAQLIDDAVATAGETVAPILGVGVHAALDAQGATLNAVPAMTSGLISGVAGGALDPQDFLGGAGPTGLSGYTFGGSGPLVALAGLGFFVLLAMRRSTFATRAMPGSPVYETDSSPD
jgi:hypothetical protein